MSSKDAAKHTADHIVLCVLAHRFKTFPQESGVGKPGMESCRSSQGECSEDTTITVTAAGIAHAGAPKHDNKGFLTLHGYRIRGDTSCNTACSGAEKHKLQVDAAALSAKVCKVCGKLDNIIAFCNDKVHCKGIEMQDGQKCAVLKFPDWAPDPYVYPSVAAAPGWTAYIQAQGWQSRCDGCFK